MTPTGPRLRGVSPPFTPSGRAAILRSRTGQVTIDRPNVGGHTGMMLRWRADRQKIESLLPPPLEPTDRTEEVYCFLNQTQGGLNLFLGDDQRSALLSVEPQHLNWHELILYIQCQFEGAYGQYIPLIYKDVDHGVLLGHQNGWHTKLAAFHRSFPFPAHAEREMRPAATVRMSVSRLDDLLISASLRVEREIDPAQVPMGSARPPLFGIRYFPDLTRDDGAPLVHDLVLRRPRTPDSQSGPARFSRAWAGKADVVLGTSDLDELDLYRPIEMLEGYFVHLTTLSGVRTPAGERMTRVLRDYRATTVRR